MTKNVVVIGGGHGQSAICRGIKNIENLNITAIVTVADDGGSTGRLRRQFHIPAMGDIRNVMIALAGSESLMSDLMDYRFADTEGSEMDVAGHNLGNLILTAMTDQCGSFLEAVQTIGQVLNVKGRIIPATSQVISLFARMEDDTIVKGEANIPNIDNHIRRVFYEEPVKAEPAAAVSGKGRGAQQRQRCRRDQGRAQRAAETAALALGVELLRHAPVAALSVADAIKVLDADATSSQRGGAR